ncbi:hypothetical protein ACHHYP_02007 [Achlya hypogyna]|uniref:FCH domain-containing protein n=1 Tax=Achlya hypogyna TaxID=1202772 RepID=A0A1V9Z7Z7_ACHHY|nr:hypothetical protein ACHHYP_02007 [Achlya hypogyna]
MEAEATTVPGLSFATDLLFNVDAVHKHSERGLAVHSSLLGLLKGRVALEHYYAAELARLADAFKVDDDGSSLGAALASVKGQFRNVSAQHKSLAGSLDEDVLRPLDELFKTLTKKEATVAAATARVRKQTKALEDHFRKQHARMDRSFKDAAASYAQALEAGIPPRTIQQQFQADAGNNNSPRPPTSPIDSVKLVSWLLPNELQKKESLVGAAVKATESAEAARQECRQAYVGFEDARVAQFRSLQSLLTDYQHLAEHRITSISTGLRKHVVFESAALANLQYDWQMVTKPLDAVDADADLRVFILHHYRPVVPHMTVRDLCKVDTLPHPPRSHPFGLYDVTLRRYPLDTTGNTASVYGRLVTRDQRIFATEVKPATVPVVAAPIVAKAVQAAVACAIAAVKLENNHALKSPRDSDSDGRSESSESTHSAE